MKKMTQLFTFALILSGTAINAQTHQKIGANATNINASAAFEIESTTKGFLTPRMTVAQRNLIASPAAGLIIWSIDCNPN